MLYLSDLFDLCDLSDLIEDSDVVSDFEEDTDDDELDDADDIDKTSSLIFFLLNNKSLLNLLFEKLLNLELLNFPDELLKLKGDFDIDIIFDYFFLFNYFYIIIKVSDA